MKEKNYIDIQINKFIREIVYWLVSKEVIESWKDCTRFYLNWRKDWISISSSIINELNSLWVIKLELLATWEWEEDYYWWDETRWEFLGFDEWKGGYYKVRLAEEGKEWFLNSLKIENDLNISDIEIQKERVMCLLKAHQEKKWNIKLLSLPKDFVLLDDFSDIIISSTNWLKIIFLFESEWLLRIDDLFIDSDKNLNLALNIKRVLYWVSIDRVNFKWGIYYSRKTKTFYSNDDKTLAYPISSKPNLFKLMEYLIENKNIWCSISDAREYSYGDEIEKSNKTRVIVDTKEKLENKIYNDIRNMTDSINTALNKGKTKVKFIKATNSSVVLLNID